MPYYDLRCKECGRMFSIKASISQRSEKEIPCPECGGTELDAVYSASPNVLIRKNAEPAPQCPNAARLWRLLPPQPVLKKSCARWFSGVLLCCCLLNLFCPAPGQKSVADRLLSGRYFRRSGYSGSPDCNGPDRPDDFGKLYGRLVSDGLSGKS